MTISVLFGIAFLLPPIAGVLSLVFGKSFSGEGNTAVQSLFILSGISGLVGSALLCVSLAKSGTTEIILSLPGPFGSVFAVTPFSAFFLSLIYIGVTLTSFFAIAYLPHYANTYSAPVLNFVSGVFVTGLQAVVLSQTVFSFLLFWELMSVAAYFLVIADRKAESLRAGFLYFVMTHIGFVSLLAGFLILSGGNPFLDFGAVQGLVHTMPLSLQSAAFVLLFVGFGSKAGLVPLHQWLPEAHPAAPSHSSALLSGVMLKVALFGFLQALLLFPGVPVSWAISILAVGLLSAFSGALRAAVESDLKKLLAFSSIENMGLLFSGVGALALVFAIPQFSAAVPPLAEGLIFFIALHTVCHSLFKTGLFMAAGAIISETHARDMDRMGGFARKWPLFSGAFLALALAAAALPPSGTFFAEWTLLQTLASSLSSLPRPFSIAAALVLSAVALVAGLAAFTFVKAFSSIFLGRGRTDVRPIRPLPMLLVLPPLFAGVLAFAASALIPFFLKSSEAISPAVLEGAGRSFFSGTPTDPATVFFLFASAFAAVFLLYKVFSGGTRIRLTDTWDCGQPLTLRMEYTATGFAAPIRFFFRSFFISEKRIVSDPIVSGNRWIREQSISQTLSSFSERILYQPLGAAALRISRTMKRLQSGNVQFYLFLVFVALIAVITAAL